MTDLALDALRRQLQAIHDAFPAINSSRRPRPPIIDATEAASGDVAPAQPIPGLSAFAHRVDREIDYLGGVSALTTATALPTWSQVSR